MIETFSGYVIPVIPCLAFRGDSLGIIPLSFVYFCDDKPAVGRTVETCYSRLRKKRCF